MMLRATLDLPIPAAIAVERLYPMMQPYGLEKLSDDAYQAGLLMLTRVGPFGETRGLSKTVRVDTLEPRTTADGVRIPFRWVATGRTGALFPTLDADLDVSAVDEQHCRVSVNAVYTPPLGAAGATLDRLILHRAARATMRELLRGLAREALDLSVDAPTNGAGHTGEIRFYPDEPAETASG